MPNVGKAGARGIAHGVVATGEGAMIFARSLDDLGAFEETVNTLR